MFIFYNIFFNATNKFKINEKKTKLNFEIDDDIKNLIDKFNDNILRKIRGKKDIFNYIDTFLKDMRNRSQKLAGKIE
jgi:hypothetical protein